MLASISEILMETFPSTFLYTTVWYAFLLLVVIAVYWLGYGQFQLLKKLGIKGPKPLPFIGHLVDFFKHKFQIHHVMDDYCKRFGNCFGVYFNGVPTLIISDPEMLKQVFIKDFNKFHDRKLSFELPEPYDSFMTIVQGERWKFIRNTLTPSFTSGKMRPMSQLMNGICDTLVSKCKQAAENKEAVNIVKFQQSLTMEAILIAAFGVEAHSQTDPDDQLTKKALFSMQQPKWINFVALIPGTSKLIKYLPYGFSYLLDPMKHVAKDIIKQRRSCGFQGRKKDLLQLMVDAQDTPDRNGRCLNDDEVIAQSLVFLLAGYETSSTTLALTCYNLAVNQDIQEKLYQEILEALPNKEDVPDFDTVQQFEYLNMVISETLRLYPPGFIILRTCNEECEVKGVTIKKDMNIMAPVYSIHRNPQFWDEPEKFDPERFSSEAKAARDPLTYLPFGHGPRNCIGMRFAQLEMKIVLARLIKEFRLEISEETLPPKVIALGTLTVREPILLKVVKR